MYFKYYIIITPGLTLLLPAQMLDFSGHRPPELADRAWETWVPEPACRISRLHTPTRKSVLLWRENKFCQILKSMTLWWEAHIPENSSIYTCGN